MRQRTSAYQGFTQLLSSAPETADSWVMREPSFPIDQLPTDQTITGQLPPNLTPSVQISLHPASFVQLPFYQPLVDHPPSEQQPSMSSQQTSHQTTPSSSNEALTSPEKRLLTEQEKKDNHIRSEQKRRFNVRTGMVKLSEIIPGAEKLFTSEIKMFDKYGTYVAQLVEERKAMVQELEAKGCVVEEHFKWT